MNAPKNTLRLSIPDDACAKARELLADGLDPDTRLEFMRGDVVCLRGTVRAFASRKLTVSNSGTPVHRKLTATERLDLAPLVRKSIDPLAR